MYSVFVSSFTQVAVHKVVPTTDDDKTILAAIAKEWVCNNVGLNNYIDTLAPDYDMSTTPVGAYLLRYGSSDDIEVSIVRQAGWWSKTHEYQGRFSVKRVAEIEANDIKTSQLQSELARAKETIHRLENTVSQYEKDIRVLKQSASSTQARPQENTYDSVISELKRFHARVAKN